MKKLIFFLVGGIALLNLSSSDYNFSEAFGVTDDSYSVSSLGTYNHIIPIQVTPGINGLQPNLAFVYDSNSGGGNMGIGWSLSGLSKIIRAGNNYAQNGKTQGVQFNNEDVFLLDGQYLTCVKRQNGGANSEYRTESETFNRIYLEGGRIVTGSNSQKYFVVKKPNGQTYWYGNSKDSRVVFKINGKREISEWLINKIQDVNGNFILFTYDIIDTYPRIKEIEYSNSDKLPIGSVIFNYLNEEGDPNKKISNVQFYKENTFLNKNVLTSVESSVIGNTGKHYRLIYDENYNRITQIVESPEGKGNSLRPTKLDYYEIDTLRFSVSKNIEKPYDPLGKTPIKEIVADFDLDGRTENFVFKEFKTSLLVERFEKNEQDVFTLKDSDTIEKGSYTVGSKIDLKYLGTGDFNGDGYTDLYTKTGVYLNKKNNEKLPFKFDEKIGFETEDNFEKLAGKDGQILSINLGQDLKDKIAVVNNTSRKIDLYSIERISGDSTIIKRLDKKNFEKNFFDEKVSFAQNPEIKLVQTSRTEVSLAIRGTKEGTSFYYINYSDNKYKIKKDDINIPKSTSTSTSISFEDLNLDGNQELVSLPNAATNSIEVNFSGINSSRNKSKEIESLSSIPIPNAIPQKIKFGNFLNSGFKEIFVPLEEKKFKIYALKVSKSNGNPLNKIGIDTIFLDDGKRFKVEDKIPDFLTSKYGFSDLNGDGITDLTVSKVENSKTIIKEYYNELKFVNRLKSVEDGFGNIVKINYSTTLDKEVYENTKKELEANKYKYVYGPFVVVKSIDYSNGLNEIDGNSLGINSIKYQYKNLITETRGRGLAGFEYFVKKTLVDSNVVEKKFEHKFPLTGKLLAEKRFNNEGEEYFSQTNEWIVKDYEKSNKTFRINKTVDFETSTKLMEIEEFNRTGKRHLALLGTTTIVNKELGENKKYQQKSSTKLQFEYDDYGNIINKKSFLNDKTIETRRTYSNYTKNNTLEGVYRLGLILSDSTLVYNDTLKTEPRVFRYIYDGRGQLRQKIREPNDERFKHITKLDYDKFGNVRYKEVLAQDLRTFETYRYDEFGRYLIESKNALSHKTTFTYNDFFGLVELEKNPNGIDLRKEYDDYGNIKRIKLRSGEIIDYTYSIDDVQLAFAGGIKNSFYQIISKSNLSKPIRKFYDRKGRETGSITFGLDTVQYKVTSVKGEPSLVKLDEGEYIERLIVSKQEYDIQGNIVKSFKPKFYQFHFGGPNDLMDANPEELNEYVTLYQYDNYGRLTKTILPDGNEISKEYYALIEIDKDAKGNKRITFYNKNGEIEEIKNAYGHSVHYEYDIWGNLCAVKSKENIIKTKYDRIGRKISTFDSHIGKVIYDYDGFDRVRKETTNSQREVQIEFDLLSRVKSKTTSEKFISWTYDKEYIGGISEISTINANDNSVFTNEKFKYDDLGNILRSDIKFKGDKKYSTEFVYDKYHRLSKKVYPRTRNNQDIPFTIKYDYTNNVVTKISELKESEDDLIQNKIFEIRETDALGRIVEQAFGSQTDKNHARTNFTYAKDNNQLNSIKTQRFSKNLVFSQNTSILNSQNQNLQGITLDYDENYNLKYQNNVSTNKTSEYDYDALNRLDGFKINGKWMNIKIDDFGNIQEKGDTGQYVYENQNANQQLTYIIKDKIIQHEFDYDDFGNVIIEKRKNGDIIEINYNSFNKPTSITKGNVIQTFKYGSSNREIENTLQKDSTVIRKSTKPYADFEIVIEGEKISYIHYVILNGSLIASHNEVYANDKAKKSKSYYFKDHLGSIELVTDEDFNPLVRYSYDPFGKRSQLEIDGTKNRALITKGFTGHEHLSSFGYINAKGRFYNPHIGRFLSPDPFIQSSLNLQSLNRYSYVLNNPLNLVDPSGFFFKKFIRSVGRAIGGALKAVSNIGREVIEFHKNVFNEAERFTEKYGKQLIVIAAAAAITYFSAGTLSGFGAAMLSGASWGAGIASSITAIKGGSLSEIIDAGFTGAVSGATAAAAAFSIGVSFKEAKVSTNFGESGYFAKGLAHGTSGGIQAEINGGDFENGFLSASISYSFTPLNEKIFGNPVDNPENALQRIAFSSTIGATTSYVSGGNIMEGALTSGFIRAYNCETGGLFTGLEMASKLDKGDYVGAAMSFAGYKGGIYMMACVAGGPINPICAVGIGLTVTSAAYSAYEYFSPQTEVYNMPSGVSPYIYKSNVPILKEPTNGSQIRASRW